MKINRIKELSFKTKCLIGVFVTTLIIGCLTPIAGDDWQNYIVGSTGIKNAIENAIDMYRTWEGRFVSRLFINFFTYHKWIWNLLNAGLMTVLVGCFYQFMTKKEKKIFYLLPLVGLLLVNNNFITQCYLWLAGNMTYVIPAILTILVFTILYKNQNKEIHLGTYLLLFLLSFIIPMFVENIGCAYVVGMLLLLGMQYYKDKKFSIPLFIMLLLSSIALIIMLKSPGSAIRMEMNETFNSMNLFEKVFSNLKNFNTYTFTVNIFILIAMMIPINSMICKKIEKKSFCIFALVIWNIIPVLSIIQNIIYMIPLDLSANNFGILTTSNWYYIFYWAVFGIAFLSSIFVHIQKKEDAWFLFVMTLTGVVSMVVMLLTPIWGERISTLFVFIIILVSSRMIVEINFSAPKILNKIIIALFIGGLLIHTGYAVNNKVFDIRRNNTIENAKQNGDKEIPVYTNKIVTVWNYVPWNELHCRGFKEYHKIADDTQLKIKILTKQEWLDYMLTGNVNKSGG